MKERMLAGERYIADDPELVAGRDRATALLRRFNAGEAAVLHQLLKSVGEGAEILPPLYCDYGSNTTFGARSFANFNTVILDPAPVTIGEEVLIASGVQIITATHPLEPEERRAAWELARPITIEDGVWLGAGVLVLPGVTIGENTAVGAGAVVTKDLPAGVLAYGNPARVIREL